jgi:hypothetical protein
MTATGQVTTARRRESAAVSATGYRPGGIAGIAFAVLFIVGMLMPTTGFQDMTDAEVVTFFGDSGNQTTYIASAYIIAVAGIAFLYFVSTLRSLLARSEGASATLVTFVGIAGGVFVALLFAGFAATVAVPGGVAIGGEPVPSADLLRMMPQLGHGLVLVFGMLAASAMIAAASAIILKDATLPRWLAWAGFACAVLLLAGAMFMPTMALPIWVIATSIVLLRRPSEQPALR